MSEGKQVHIRLQSDLYDRLKGEAERYSLTIAALASVIILNHLGEVEFQALTIRRLDDGESAKSD